MTLENKTEERVKARTEREMVGRVIPPNVMMARRVDDGEKPDFDGIGCVEMGCEVSQFS
jgi:hypothetical protein